MKHLCEETFIEAFDTLGVRSSLRVQRYREFAVGLDAGEYNIFFVPMGVTLSGFTFLNEDRAIACMIELDKLRNNWLGLEEADWEALRPAILSIFANYGPVLDKAEPGETPVEVFPETLNGYADRDSRDL